MRTFSILHELPDTQVLVDTTFNHEADEHELTIKFWCEWMNGYASMKLSWSADKEADFEKAFEELKSPEKALEWIEGFNDKFKNL